MKWLVGYSIIVGVITLGCAREVYGQDRRPYEQSFRLPIETLIKAQYGNDYEVGIEVIDSVLNTETCYYCDEVTDPYGTLQGCVLFAATRSFAGQDSGFFGIYKNGQILWKTDRIIQGEWDNTYATFDMNKDGDVDILTTWEQNGDPSILYMWIFSWNGTSGRIINETDSSIAGPQTVLSGRSFQVFIGEDDSVKVVRSIIPSESADSSVTYRWDGERYSYSPNQLSLDQFLPANRLSISTNAYVALLDSMYDYSYTWMNSNGSKQAIQRLYLVGVKSGSQPKTPNSKWMSVAWPDTPVVGWTSLAYAEEMIRPGHTKSGFGLLSVGLPGISRYFAQGWRPLPTASSNGAPPTIDQYRDDIFTNSVEGDTVAPKHLVTPFSCLYGLDSLRSFVSQSRSLGWINDDQRALKYTTFVDSALAQLQRSDSRLLRATVDSILSNASRDSAISLTSEAYALIFFNAEYLLTQLPEPPPQYTLSLSVGGGGSVSKSPDQTVYDSASIVTLTAEPSAGYLFSAWSGDTTGTTNPINILMSGNKSIVATFVPNTDTITPSSGAHGSISPSSAVVVNYGSNQRFTFAADTGYRVDSVIVDDVKIDSTLGYTFADVVADHTIRVTFKIDHNLLVPSRFATIQAAIDFSRHGDTISVGAGTYNEIPAIETRDSLAIIATGSLDQVTVRGFRIFESNSITIKGFVVNAHGTLTDGIRIESVGGTNNRITFEANEIKNSSHNGIITTAWSNNIRIVDNRIDSNAHNGLSIAGAATYIINNTIVKNGQNGIFSGCQDNLYVVNDIISYNGTSGGSYYGVYRDICRTEDPYGPSREGGVQPNSITPQPCPSCIMLINNLITGNNGITRTTAPKASKDLYNYTEILDANNDSGNWTTAGNEGTGISGATTVAFGSVFVASSPIDLHLKSGAFPIRGVNSWNAPDSAAGAIPAFDFEGTTRPSGTAVDMGADEKP